MAFTSQVGNCLGDLFETLFFKGVHIHKFFIILPPNSVPFKCSEDENASPDSALCISVNLCHLLGSWKTWYLEESVLRQ